MKLRFLGTNGWYSTGTGNTSCVMIEARDSFVVFDAGDGIYKLDKHLTSGMPVYLFLSHFHLDHIYGFHILNKFRFGNPLTIFGQPGTREAVERIANKPYAIPLEKLKIKSSFKELKEGMHDKPDTPFPVECRYLKHMDPCFGYRIELDGKVITYCTDTGLCDNLVKLSQNADILIMESSYKRAEQSAIYDGWPHLGPKESAEIAKKASVKRLFLTHFDPSLYPAIKDRKEAEAIAKKIFPNTVAANDDMETDI